MHSLCNDDILCDGNDEYDVLVRYVKVHLGRERRILELVVIRACTANERMYVHKI